MKLAKRAQARPYPQQYYFSREQDTYRGTVGKGWSRTEEEEGTEVAGHRWAWGGQPKCFWILP